MTTTEAKYYHTQLAIACTSFNAERYNEDCFKEFLEVMLTDDDQFRKTYSYSIYSDTFSVPHNLFVPRFHTYYLNSDKKHVIILDAGMIDLPMVYNHHEYYIYNDKELFAKFEEKYDNVTHIHSIKEIIKGSEDVSATD
jgi:hypothetical protein